jgi:hypothetical protein
MLQYNIIPARSLIDIPSYPGSQIRWILRKQGVKWIHLAQVRVQWYDHEHVNETSGCTEGRELE